MKKDFILKVIPMIIGMMSFADFCNAETEGQFSSNELPGLFSVSAAKKVYFSPGNLQYMPSTRTWRFAVHQWDYVGDDVNGNVYYDETKCDNNKMSPSYNGWIDLFGWGTGNDPIKSSIRYEDYSNYTDWGTNKIGNYSHNTWRTLTKDEWVYLFHGRSNAERLFAFGKVNGVKGIILLPDGWVAPAGIDFVASVTKGLFWDEDNYTNDTHTDYTDNIYTSNQWKMMEQAGAVFLPTAGFRDGARIHNAGDNGCYWSSTSFTPGDAYNLKFNSIIIFPQWVNNRLFKSSVRLVR